MEDLAYRRLLDQYYLREGPLPADIQATAKLVRMRSMAADVEVVLKEFFVLTDDGWRHSRCDKEIAHMQDKQSKARASAEQSVKSRRASAERALLEQAADAERTLAKQSTDVELPTPTPTPIPTTKKRTNTGAVALTVESLVSDGLTAQTAAEFVAHRSAKGSKLTPRAWQGICAEAGKAGWPVEQAVCKALARGWTGFEASWVAGEVRTNGARTDAEPAWRTEQRERVAAFAGPAAAKRSTSTVVEIIDAATARLG
jgi:uncharacterized protein YdaU (DUF1376 family)